MALNDLQKDKLQLIVNDEVLLNAIYQVFMDVIEAKKPIVNEQDQNELLGEKYRAYEAAKKMVGDGFIQLMTHQRQLIQNKKFNKAR